MKLIAYILISIIVWVYAFNVWAVDIEWFDVQDKSVLQVTCNKKEYRLVLKTVEISKKQRQIDKWFDSIINNCKEY